MIKCEIREMYDAYGTGNFTEDKSRREAFEMKEWVVERAISLHNAMERKKHETSKYVSYESQADARRIIEYIYYK